MNKKEQTKFNRNKRVLDFLMLNCKKFNSDISVFEKHVLEFNEKMNLLENYLIEYKVDNKLKTVLKKNERKMMEKYIVIISGTLRAYYFHNNDEISAEKHKITKSYLGQQVEENCLFTCKSILKDAKEIKDKLVHFGPIEKMLIELENRIENYQTLYEESKKARLDKIISKKLILETLVDCDKFISIFKNLMIGLESKHNELFNEYLKLNALNFTEDSEVNNS